MASPYHYKMNIAQADYSPIVEAGRAWNDAFKEAGEAFGKIGSAYFEEKAFEQQVSDFMKTKSGKRQLEQYGVKIDEEKPEEALKHVKGVIKSKGGFQEFRAAMMQEIQEKRNAKQARQQNYLFQEQQEKIKAEKDHAMRMNGSVPNEKATYLDNRMSEIREIRSSLGTEMENGTIDPDEYNRSFYDLGKEMTRLQKERSNTPDSTPMLELDPAKFSDAYGEVTSPYQAMLKNKAVAELQTRKDTLLNKTNKTAAEALQLKNLQDEERAAALAPTFRPTQKVILDEGVAMQEIAAFAEQNELQLSGEQMDRLKQQYTIAPVKDIRSEKRYYEKENRINDADSVIESSNYLLDFLDTKNDQGEPNPLTDTAAIEKLARMLQPTGILTEDDINRVSGSAGLVDRFHRAVQKATDGTLDEASRKDLRDAADAFRIVASELKVKGTESAISEIANSYVDPSDPYNGAFKKQVRDRFFSEEYNNIDPKFLPGNQPKSPKEASEGQRVQVMDDGKPTTGKLIRTLPNGQQVFLINGKMKTIDP